MYFDSLTASAVFVRRITRFCSSYWMTLVNDTWIAPGCSSDEVSWRNQDKSLKLANQKRNFIFNRNITWSFCTLQQPFTYRHYARLVCELQCIPHPPKLSWLRMPAFTLIMKHTEVSWIVCTRLSEKYHSARKSHPNLKYTLSHTCIT